MLLNDRVIGRGRYQDEFPQRWFELLCFLDLRFKLIRIDRSAEVGVLALTLHSDKWTRATATLAEHIYAVLPLTGPAVGLSGRIIERVLEQQAHGSFQRLPILGRRKGGG